eukprot:1963961-Prorocentrum_lima.AAC.1
MTSSLVGSEMCIRDRSKRVELRRQLDLTSGRRRIAAVTSSEPLRAVSYTHLRLPTICSV